jgi:hypothetical protein
MKAALLEHLAACERIVRDGDELVPAWRVITAEGNYLIFTRFDHEKPGQAEHVMHMMRRFMVWRKAFGFILGIEVWLGGQKTRQGEEAIFVLGLSHETPAAAVMRRLRRQAAVVELGAEEWVPAEQIDPTFFDVLPGRVEVLADGEAEELARIFGENGELSAALSRS